MDAKKWIKVLGTVAAVVSFGANILGNWAGTKQLEAKIDERARDVYYAEKEKEAEETKSEENEDE